MGVAENCRAVESLWRCFSEKRFDDAKKLFHRNFTALWPQSQECFSGADNFVALNRAYPGRFQFRMLRLHSDANSVSAELLVAPDGAKPVFVVGFYEFSRGKIVRAVEYFADTYEAPQWRGKYRG